MGQGCRPGLVQAACCASVTARAGTARCLCPLREWQAPREWQPAKAGPARGGFAFGRRGTPAQYANDKPGANPRECRGRALPLQPCRRVTSVLCARRPPIFRPADSNHRRSRTHRKAPTAKPKAVDPLQIVRCSKVSHVILRPQLYDTIASTIPRCQRRCMLPRSVFIIGPHDLRLDGIRRLLTDMSELTIVGDNLEPSGVLPAVIAAAPGVVLIAASAGGGGSMAGWGRLRPPPRIRHCDRRRRLQRSAALDISRVGLPRLCGMGCDEP